MSNKSSYLPLNESICSALVNRATLFVHVVAMPGIPVSTPEHLHRPSLLSCYRSLLVMWIKYKVVPDFVIIMSEMHM